MNEHTPRSGSSVRRDICKHSNFVTTACNDENEGNLNDGNINQNFINPQTTRVGNCTFLTWNIEGLYAKLFDNDFISFVASHDFVCLTETFLLNELQLSVFPDHHIYYQFAKKLSQKGRPSGGVLCLVRKRYKALIKEINVNMGNFVLLYINKTLFNLNKDVLYVGAYVPPEGSPYYNLLDLEKDGISVLENCLLDTVLLDKDVHVMINGDLNSRTSNASQTILSELDYADPYDTKEEPIKRHSQDTVMNSFGKSLLAMCTALDLCIVNGTCNGDRLGRFTYICDTGCSVDDYFLISRTLYASLFDGCKLEILDRIECKHLPVKMTIDFPNKNMNTNNDLQNEGKIEKYCWKEENKDTFLSNITKEHFKKMYNDAMNHIDINIDTALNKFNDCIRDAGLCLKTYIGQNKRKEQKWFDYECITKRKEVRKMLRNLNKSIEKVNAKNQGKECRRNDTNNFENEEYEHETESSDVCRQKYCVSRREYNRLKERKKNEYSNATMNKNSCIFG